VLSQHSRTEALADVLRHVETMAADVAAMRRTIVTQDLATSDLQYLCRCFDLLDLELGAVRDYVNGMR
jgi:hypothetical protein